MFAFLGWWLIVSLIFTLGFIVGAGLANGGD